MLNYPHFKYSETCWNKENKLTNSCYERKWFVTSYSLIVLNLFHHVNKPFLPVNEILTHLKIKYKVSMWATLWSNKRYFKFFVIFFCPNFFFWWFLDLVCICFHFQGFIYSRKLRGLWLGVKLSFLMLTDNQFAFSYGCLQWRIFELGSISRANTKVT